MRPQPHTNITCRSVGKFSSVTDMRYCRCRQSGHMEGRRWICARLVGWWSMTALLCRTGGSAIGLSATDAWALEPLPMMHPTMDLTGGPGESTFSAWSKKPQSVICALPTTIWLHQPTLLSAEELWRWRFILQDNCPCSGLTAPKRMPPLHGGMGGGFVGTQGMGGSLGFDGLTRLRNGCSRSTPRSFSGSAYP